MGLEFGSFARGKGARPNLHTNQLAVRVVAGREQDHLELAAVCEMEPVEPVTRTILIVGESVNQPGDGGAQFFERPAGRQAFNARRRLSEGANAGAPPVSLNGCSLDDDGEFGSWAIRVAVARAIGS